MNIKAHYQLDPKEVRVYTKENSCIFKKNNEEYGGLSNMATGFPLCVKGIAIKTSEALYQACRFPHLPEIQRKIIEEKSPMAVKMISNANKKQSRQDWDNIRVKVMKWCIQVKLAQNFVPFGTLLHETGLKSIVENSTKDNFWGAIPNKEGTLYTGKNALGRLLMDLRQTFYSKDCYSLLYIEPPQIENFLFLGETITILDERMNFFDWLLNYWGSSTKSKMGDTYIPIKTNQTYVNNTTSDLFLSKALCVKMNSTLKKNAKAKKQQKNEILQQKLL